MSFDEPCQSKGGAPIEDYSHTIVFIDVILDGIVPYFQYPIPGLNGFGCRQVEKSITIPIKDAKQAEKLNYYAVAYDQSGLASPRTPEKSRGLVFQTKAENYRLE